MAEIRSPYFSCGVDYRGEDAEIQSPYFSYVTRDYHGDNPEIPSPYFSFGTQDYYRNNAEIHSSYYPVGDHHGENSETHNDEELYKYIVGEAAEKMYAKMSPIDLKCIYRIPKDLLDKLGKGIYTPRKISIGPTYHGEKDFQPMEQHKVKYFEAFCCRAAKRTESQNSKFLRRLWETIEEKEEEIKQCYEAVIIQEFSKDENHEQEFVSPKKEKELGKEKKFVKMVLLDALFILEYLLRYEDRKKYEDNGYEDTKIYKDDPIFREMRHLIRWDLMLLQNQLPLFILHELYNLLLEDSEENYTPFPDLALAYFKRLIKSNYKPDVNEILHFTDLIRSLLCYKHPALDVREPMERFYTANQLRQAGIKFKGLQNECLLKITFTSTKAVLPIPCLEINYYTECIFGNIMALELLHYDKEEYVCHYVKLFETLIAKPKDADHLIKKKVIGTSKKGDAVKALIDKLSAVTFEEYSCYHTLYKQLDQHYQKTWPKNRAYFRETYFGNLWKGTATTSATILLILAFVQALCSYLALPSQDKGGVILFLLLLASVILFVSFLFCLKYLFSQ